MKTVKYDKTMTVTHRLTWAVVNKKDKPIARCGFYESKQTAEFITEHMPKPKGSRVARVWVDWITYWQGEGARMPILIARRKR